MVELITNYCSHSQLRLAVTRLTLLASLGDHAPKSGLRRASQLRRPDDGWPDESTGCGDRGQGCWGGTCTAPAAEPAGPAGQQARQAREPQPGAQPGRQPGPQPEPGPQPGPEPVPQPEQPTLVPEDPQCQCQRVQLLRGGGGRKANICWKVLERLAASKELYQLLELAGKCAAGSPLHHRPQAAQIAALVSSTVELID